MSVTICVWCDTRVDTDHNETCPGCERCPFGEYMFCGTCHYFVESTSELLIAKTDKQGSCTKNGKAVDYDTEACMNYDDADYSMPKRF